MQALVIVTQPDHAFAILPMLARAGITVDVIATSPLLRLSRHVRRAVIVEHTTDLARHAQEAVTARGPSYEWVIAADDTTLGELKTFEQRTGKDCGLLPLMPGADREHVFSKIGLSRALCAAGIKTPAFRVASTCEGAVAAARAIGYPVMVKLDASGGGLGVCECATDAAIRTVPFGFDAPVLVQKKIEGRELDLSAIYFEGKLVHFSCSCFERTTSRFGPSSLRTYYAAESAEGTLFDEVAMIGKALGIHGFTNHACIEARDGTGRYHIEVDLRPNIWADYSQFVGEDGAPRIRGWFKHRKVLERTDGPGLVRPALRIPHYMRLNSLNSSPTVTAFGISSPRATRGWRASFSSCGHCAESFGRARSRFPSPRGGSCCAG